VTEKTQVNGSAKLSKDAHSMQNRGETEVTVSRLPPLNSTPAHRRRWKQMEANNERA